MFQEKNFLAKITQDEQLSESEEQVIENLRHTSDPRLKEDSFGGIYSREEIDRDIASIKKQEAKHNVLTERGQLLEKLLLQQIYHSCWFGEDCETVRTAKHDDYANHTDFVAEWGDDESIKLAVDTTATADLETIEKKFIKIQHDLDKGHGTTIKYFQSNLVWQEEPKKEGLKDIPRVIIAVDHDNLAEICKTLVENGGKTKLGNSSLQISILEDIIAQLEAQIEYLEKNSDTEPELDIYKNITTAKKYLEKILDKKLKNPEIKKKGHIKNEPIASREKIVLAI